jgi:hypothetical protein
MCAISEQVARLSDVLCKCTRNRAAVEKVDEIGRQLLG